MSAIGGLADNQVDRELSPFGHNRTFVALILCRSRSEIFHVTTELWRERIRVIFPPVVDSLKVHQVREALFLGEQQASLSRASVGRVEQRVKDVEVSA